MLELLIFLSFLCAVFCFCIAGAVATEKPGASPPHDMLNLFEIQPEPN